MPDDRPRTCWFTETPCPRCGLELMTNGAYLWCVKACGYGIDVKVKATEGTNDADH